MKRLVGLCLVAVLVAAIAIVRPTVGEGDGAYRVQAVFDTAKGLVPGQTVKIAGTEVGRVTDVEFAPGPAALVTFEVPDRFAPFRADASCRILPEGLLSENYVECDPGSKGSLEGEVPRVPLANTAVPTSLQEVLNVFAMPVNQRISVFLAELGLMGAGRGDQINDLIRRANPALREARDLLALLSEQREEINRAIDGTDRVMNALARRTSDVRSFVREAAGLSTRTALRREQLAATVRELAPMLRSVRRGLRPVDAATASLTPLLGDLRDAAPHLDEFAGRFPPSPRPAPGRSTACGASRRPDGPRSRRSCRR